MKTIISIDFGTSTTAVSMTTLESRFAPELIEIDGIKVVDSVLRFNDKGDDIDQVGNEAICEAYSFPDRTFFEFKPHIGESIEYKVGFSEKIYSAEDISTLFLEKIRKKIEDQQFNGAPLSGMDVLCVIGYPAEWSGSKKALVLEAAQKAGFPNAIGCEEPLGAVYYHHYKGDLSIDDDQLVIVYDFGGGTSDVAILRTKKGFKPEIIGFGGSDLGGCHFDKKLTDYIASRIMAETGLSEISHRDKVQIKIYAKMLKEKLSNAIINNLQKVEATIPVLEATKSSYRIVLEKDEFVAECKKLIGKFESPIDMALKLSGVKIEDINISILAGGAGRSYFARESIREYFPNDLEIQSTNPQEVVSKGLAIFGRIKEESTIVNAQTSESPHSRERTISEAATINNKTEKKQSSKRILEALKSIGIPKNKKILAVFSVILLVLIAINIFNHFTSPENEILINTMYEINPTIREIDEIIAKKRSMGLSKRINILKENDISHAPQDFKQAYNHYILVTIFLADAYPTFFSFGNTEESSSEINKRHARYNKARRKLFEVARKHGYKESEF